MGSAPSPRDRFAVMQDALKEPERRNPPIATRTGRPPAWCRPPATRRTTKAERTAGPGGSGPSRHRARPRACARDFQDDALHRSRNGAVSPLRGSGLAGVGSAALAGAAPATYLESQLEPCNEGFLIFVWLGRPTMTPNCEVHLQRHPCGVPAFHAPKSLPGALGRLPEEQRQGARPVPRRADPCRTAGRTPGPLPLFSEPRARPRHRSPSPARQRRHG